MKKDSLALVLQPRDYQLTSITTAELSVRHFENDTVMNSKGTHIILALTQREQKAKHYMYFNPSLFFLVVPLFLACTQVGQRSTLP